MTSDSLRMWVIYDHPSDHPHNFVARLWRVTAGKTDATDTVLMGPLEDLRTAMRNDGLTRLTRQAGDDPVIVEVWL